MENQAEAKTMGAEDFGFPYTPYDIQLDLMRALHQTLEKKNIGIFESPTGTKENEKLAALSASALAESTASANNISDEPSWIADFSRNKEAERVKEIETRRQERKRRLEEKLERIRNGQVSPPRKRSREVAFGYRRKLESAKTSDGSDDKENDKDERFLLDEFHSDDDRDEEDSSSDSENSSADEGLDSEDKMLQIIYCSRTHSQLSQFINEIKKTEFGKDIRCVTLGSRKSLCVNDNVRKLQSDLAISEKCLELQKSKSDAKKSQKGGCPFLDRSGQRSVRDHTLAQIRDIEELLSLGQKMVSCSYYGTRKALPYVQLVAMPYSLLLDKSARESVGINIKDNVVVFDEAHNIVEAVNDVYTIKINLRTISIAHCQLSQYLERYRKRLRGKNLFYINQISNLLRILIKYLKGCASTNVDSQCNSGDGPRTKRCPTSKMMKINDFLFEVGIDNVNIFKIEKYLKKSQICKKLLGFMEMVTEGQLKVHPNIMLPGPTAQGSKATEIAARSASSTSIGRQSPENPTEASKSNPSYRHVSALAEVYRFLAALTNSNVDGRVLISFDDGPGQFKFLMLNPAVHFREIVDKARSVILAGGTMQPVSAVIGQLFAHIPRERIDVFSCGHIVPEENLTAVTFARGPSGADLVFTHKERTLTAQMDELGRLICNLCNVVPDGFVCFLPSYAYEEHLFRYWEKSGIIARISCKKKIFREPRATQGGDKTLAEYSAYISRCREPSKSPEISVGVSNIHPKSHTGAALFCVVGGKMSEGINFSDELARCVAVVGLPYPNPTDSELKARMDFLDAQQRENDNMKPREHATVSASKEFYEGLCMKAVNQSIGRAIRHMGDYSAIVLIDARYNRRHVVGRLPQWISSRLVQSTHFGVGFKELNAFYRQKKANPGVM